MALLRAGRPGVTIGSPGASREAGDIALSSEGTEPHPKMQANWRSRPLAAFLLNPCRIRNNLTP